jgi:hypothetical protein
LVHYTVAVRVTCVVSGGEVGRGEAINWAEDNNYDNDKSVENQRVSTRVNYRNFIFDCHFFSSIPIMNFGVWCKPLRVK